MDAERERREYILRKNQERDARLDTKRRNERSSIQFAFGSSTPRLLDPVEVNLATPTGSYWGNRRSTSITNVSYGGGGGGGGATQISRRSSERELNDGAKKRATSAGGLDRPEGTLQLYTLLLEFCLLLLNFYQQQKKKIQQQTTHDCLSFIHKKRHDIHFIYIQTHMNTFITHIHEFIEVSSFTLIHTQHTFWRLRFFAHSLFRSTIFFFFISFKTHKKK